MCLLRSQSVIISLYKEAGEETQPGVSELNQLTNNEGELVSIDSMVLALSRTPNIGNKLSYRKKMQTFGAQSVIISMSRR